jgi:hypothetical protein
MLTTAVDFIKHSSQRLDLSKYRFCTLRRGRRNTIYSSKFYILPIDYSYSGLFSDNVEVANAIINTLQ